MKTINELEIYALATPLGRTKYVWADLQKQAERKNTKGKSVKDAQAQEGEAKQDVQVFTKQELEKLFQYDKRHEEQLNVDQRAYQLVLDCQLVFPDDEQE